MATQKGELAAVLAGEDEGGPAPNPAVFNMTTESLAREYPRHATSLMNLVKNSEEAVRGKQH